MNQKAGCLGSVSKYEKKNILLQIVGSTFWKAPKENINEQIKSLGIFSVYSDNQWIVVLEWNNGSDTNEMAFEKLLISSVIAS